MPPECVSTYHLKFAVSSIPFFLKNWIERLKIELLGNKSSKDDPWYIELAKDCLPAIEKGRCLKLRYKGSLCFRYQDV